MPFKFNAAGRHHIPRRRQRVTNWSEYDAALRQRGGLMVWVTDEAIAAWQAGGLPAGASAGRARRFRPIMPFADGEHLFCPSPHGRVARFESDHRGRIAPDPALGAGELPAPPAARPSPPLPIRRRPPGRGSWRPACSARSPCPTAPLAPAS